MEAVTNSTSLVASTMAALGNSTSLVAAALQELGVERAALQDAFLPLLVSASTSAIVLGERSPWSIYQCTKS